MSTEEPDDLLFERICDRLEAAWQSGEIPSLGEYLVMGNDSHRAELLQELIRIDIDYRVRRNEQLKPSLYEAFGETATNYAARILAEPTPANAVSDQLMPSGELQRPLVESQEIGPYKILQRIGTGGMGQVFMAQQNEPVRRRVALKIIKSETPSGEILARFEAERQALAMMDHQNIAKVLDAGVTDDGRPYFAMELVKGIPITEYCNSNTLSPNERLSLFVQTCRAIQHAHQKGIIHRDLKPSNILVTLYDGRAVAKVIDFGLAKALHESTQLTHRTMFTQFGQVVGTLAYMSPEQAEMNALDVDTRTDVYSLGVILFELLTGSTPISAERIREEAFDQILRVIREEESPKPSTRLSESGPAIAGISQQRKMDPKRLSLILKGDLDWIVMKALEKDRTRRYDGAAALADDVERYLRHEAIEARPPSLAYQLQKSFRKHRGAFVTVAGVLILLIAALGVTTALFVRATKAEKMAKAEGSRATNAEAVARSEAATAKAAQTEAENARQSTQEAKGKLEGTLARSDLQLAVSRWKDGRVKEALELMERVPPRHRHIEWSIARRWMDGSELTLFTTMGMIRYLSFTPNMKYLVASDGSHWQVWNLAKSKMEIEFAAGSGCLSPDGREIVTVEDGRIQFWDRSSGHPTRDLKSEELAGNRPANLKFDPTGRWLVCGQQSLTVWDVRQARREWQRDQKRWVRSPCRFLVSPDSQYIISNAIISDSRDPDDSFPDDRVRENYLGNSLDSQRGYLLELKTGRPVAGQPIFTSSTHSFGPGGDFYATLDLGITRLRRTNDWSQQFEIVRPTSGMYFGAISFSPNSRWICATENSKNIGIYNVDGTTKETLYGHTQGISALRWSPDATWIASASVDGVIKLWGVVPGDATRTRGARWHESNTPDSFVIKPGCIERSNLSITASDDRSVITIDSDRLGGKVTLKHRLNVDQLAIAPRGKRVATYGWGRVRCWDTNSETVVWSNDSNSRGNLTTFTFSPDAKWLIASIHHTGILEVYDASDGTKQFPMQDGIGGLWPSSPGAEKLTTANIEFTKPEGRAHSGVCFSPDGTRLVWIGSESLVVWDCADFSELLKVDGVRDTRIVPWLESHNFSPEKRLGFSSFIEQITPDSASQFRVLRTRADIKNLSFSENGLLIVKYRNGSSPGVWDPSSTDLVRLDLRAADLQSALDESLERGVSKDGRWRALYRGSRQIYLVDLESKPVPYRRWEAAADLSNLHRLQSATATTEENVFGELFHRAWAFKLQPDDPWLWDDFHEAFDSFIERYGPNGAKAQSSAMSSLTKSRNAASVGSIPLFDKVVPPVVNEVIKLERSTNLDHITVARATREHGRVWELVKHPTKNDLANEIRRMQDIADKNLEDCYFKGGTWVTPLGVALFRDEQYRRAIETLEQSLLMIPDDDDAPAPHPIDLAFLAMSHEALGDSDSAATFLERYKQQMKQFPWNIPSDFEDNFCVDIATELSNFFDDENIEKTIEANLNRQFIKGLE